MSAVDRRWLKSVMLGAVEAPVAASAVLAQGFRDPTTGQVWTQDNVSEESGALVAIPSDHWRTTLHVANDSAGLAYAEINCRFMNAGRVVQDTHIVIPAVRPGQRVSVPVQGPRTDLFVDHVPCRLLTP